MKPRVFIGSSVEGLNVAYAVQQNLLHDAEVTVWDQGVFELSSTTIESLIKALSSADFGIFVFSPDDISKIRGNDVKSVRDNVLFELGLFVGKMGRERVYFLVPEGVDIHIPTDLIGITPGKFDSKRADGSLQAATGPASHQIRIQIKKLGPIETRESKNTPSESSGEVYDHWIMDVIDDKFESAITKLEKELQGQSGDDALKNQAWLYYCKFKLDPNIGYVTLYEHALANQNSVACQEVVANLLKREGYVDKAIEVLENAQKVHPDSGKISVELASHLDESGNQERAIFLLESTKPTINAEVALKLAEIFEHEEKTSDAFKIIRQCYISNPSNEEVAFKYARLAQECNEHTIALYLLDTLAYSNPDSIQYWGYLGNTCLALSLNNAALEAYRRAEKLIKPNQNEDWIVSNIGNLLSNVGLVTESFTYFESALKMDARSEYAHDRMASALKKKTELAKTYKKKIQEGMRLSRNLQNDEVKVS